MITQRAGERREALWVEIAPELRRIVGASAASSDLDDVLQDVAERFFRNAPESLTAEESLAWATVVARRRLIDLSRRMRPIPTDDLAAQPAMDAERTAFGHLALECARRYLREHGILESWISGGEDGPASSRDRVRRSRARRRLADHMGRKIGWPALIPRLRWIVPAIGVTAIVPLPYLVLPPVASDAPAQARQPAPFGLRDFEVPSSASPELVTTTEPSPANAAITPEPKRISERRERLRAEPFPWGGVAAGEQPHGGAESDEPSTLVCVWGLRVVADTCVAHPLE